MKTVPCRHIFFDEVSDKLSLQWIECSSLSERCESNERKCILVHLVDYARTKDTTQLSKSARSQRANCTHVWVRRTVYRSDVTDACRINNTERYATGDHSVYFRNAAPTSVDANSEKSALAVELAGSALSGYDGVICLHSQLKCKRSIHKARGARANANT